MKIKICVLALLAWTTCFIANGSEIMVNNVTLKKGETKRVAVVLENGERFTAFSMDFVLPDGITIEKYELGERFYDECQKKTDHFLSNGSWSDFYRIIGDTPQNMSIPGNEGTLLYITLKADKEIKDANYIVKITGFNQANSEELGVEFSDAEGNSIRLNAVEFAITIVTVPIQNVEFNQTKNSQQFNILGMETASKKKGVYIKDGKKVIR